MTSFEKFLYFILLPIIAVLCYPPELLRTGPTVLGILIGAMLLLGILLWRGRSLALTFAIFLQGMNVIIRIMMILPNTLDKTGKINLPMGLAMLIGLVLSLYLVLRLDRVDVRRTMVR